TSPLLQIFLAYLLMPSEFAYIAVISLFLGFSELLSDVGIGEAVIQRKRVTDNEVSSLVVFNILVTLLIIVILYLLGPVFQGFYNMDKIGNIIHLLLVTVFFNGTSSIFRVYLQRELKFRELSVIQMTRTTIEMISIITML